MNFSFPPYSEADFLQRINALTPVENYDGIYIKRDDLFNVGAGASGGKVRQCAKLVYDNLSDIKLNHNNGILTAAGLPSPQSCIVASVAKYFGLNCAVTIPWYPDHMYDKKRINASLAQRFGADVYGVGNPNPTGPEKDAKELTKELGYFQIKFGMNGTHVMHTISNQAQNIPDEVNTIVAIAGSGLSVLGVMLGIRKYNKSVENIHVVTLSDYFNRNKAQWYDILPIEEQYQGNLNVVRSKIPYQTYYKVDAPIPLDMTYESKAWQWMVNNVELGGNNVLFWVVGIKEGNMDYIEPINWHKSYYESLLDEKRANKRTQKTEENKWFTTSQERTS